MHKTQGMSLDSMVLHLDSAFEYGQVYVGLSRARSLACLEVRGFRPELVRAHAKAVQFYDAVQRVDRRGSGGGGGSGSA